MLELPVRYFRGRDGVRLAYRETGDGRPLVLLHGFCTSAVHGWVAPGHAETVAAAGHRVIMPDLRAHGDSAHPRSSSFPRDALVDDGFALVEHLGLDGYDLGGYSLGGRVVAGMLLRGATPGRAIVGGQGIREINGTGGGAGAIVRQVVSGMGTFEPGSREWKVEQWLRTTNPDPAALVRVLDTVVSHPSEAVARIGVRTLVLTGADDERAASAEALAAALPHGILATVPGNHGTAATAPELSAAIVAFLSAP